MSNLRASNVGPWISALVELIVVADTLKRDMAALHFAAPVTHVYNPLDYAWNNYETYLARFGAGRREVVLLGMNPGPWGMMQTGVPFGDPRLVRDWMGISGQVKAPRTQHSKRPILGFNCPRREISGQRLWGWAKDTFGSAEAFFARFFVLNYCPLCFLEESGRNRTPDRLPRAEQINLFEACDRALARAVEWLAPRHVIGIGQFAAARARCALDGIKVGTAPHPSPANPAANYGWGRLMNQTLQAQGVQLK